MPTDVYNMTSQSTSTTMVKAQEMKLDVVNGGMEGALVQNVSLSYNQNVQTIREFGSTNYYYFAQPPSGQLNISRLVAKDKSIVDVFPIDDGSSSMWHPPQGSGQVCPDITLSSLNSQNNVKYILRQCIITNLGGSISADGVFLQESLSIMFMSLEIA